MKRIARLSILILLISMLMSVGAIANAAGTVVYDGDADTFIFSPGSDASPSNLFENFQNVMPGDSLTERIEIRNATSNGVKIKVYMRSLGAHEGTDDFLSQMLLTVKQCGDSVLFAAPANETGGISDWVYLGTVYSGGEILLDVTLDVPITMDDTYQNSIGYIDWKFKVEELPVEPSDPKPPQTGDNSRVYQYLIVMLLCLIGMVTVYILYKREKNK